MKQGGTAGIPSLTKVYFVKDFFRDDQTNIRRSDAVSEGL